MLESNLTAEDAAIREYILQEMNKSDAPTFMAENAVFSVPEDHPLYGKKMPYEAVRDNDGSIYIYKTSNELGAGAFGTVYKAEVLFSNNTELANGSECAVKKLLNVSDNARENQLLKIAEQFYGNCECHAGDTSFAFSMMHFVPGKKLSKAITSYDDDGSLTESFSQDSTLSQSTATQSDKVDSRQPSQSGLVAEGLVAEGLVAEGLVAEGLVAEGLVAEGLVAEGSVAEGSVVQGSVVQGSVVQDDILANEAQSETAVVESNKDDIKIEPLKIVSAADSNNFEIESWLSLSKELARAVKEGAHDRGIIHRDIKPENFLIAEDGKVTLIDFGESSHPDVPPTKTTCVGTGHFMAPECFRGRPSTIKQDIYSLGRTFELLIYKQMLELYPSAYEIRPPCKGLTSFALANSISKYVDSISFDNPDNNPKLDAINDYLKVIYEMRSIDSAVRPDINQVIARLAEIEQKYKQRITSSAEASVSTSAPQPLKAPPEPMVAASVKREDFVASAGEKQKSGMLSAAKDTLLSIFKKGVEKLSNMFKRSEAAPSTDTAAKSPDTRRVHFAEPESLVQKIYKPTPPKTPSPRAPVAKVSENAAAAPVIKPATPPTTPSPRAKAALSQPATSPATSAATSPATSAPTSPATSAPTSPVSAPSLLSSSAPGEFSQPVAKPNMVQANNALNAFSNRFDEQRASSPSALASDTASVSVAPVAQKPNVLASPVVRAKESAMAYYNNPDRVEVTIGKNTGMLFAKGVHDQQVKSRNEELEQLKSQKLVSTAIKADQPVDRRSDNLKKK